MARKRLGNRRTLKGVTGEEFIESLRPCAFWTARIKQHKDPRRLWRKIASDGWSAIRDGRDCSDEASLLVSAIIFIRGRMPDSLLAEAVPPLSSVRTVVRGASRETVLSMWGML